MHFADNLTAVESVEAIPGLQVELSSSSSTSSSTNRTRVSSAGTTPRRAPHTAVVALGPSRILKSLDDCDPEESSDSSFELDD